MSDNEHKVNTYLFYSQQQHYRPDLQEKLPDSERERLAELHSDNRRQLFILGRAVLAEALAFLQQNPDYSLRYGEQGKPELLRPRHWHVNITHSGRHLLLALQRGGSIGIDVEVLRKRPYQRVAEKYFSPRAVADIAAAANPMQRFYHYWTRYEAQIKCWGSSVFADKGQKVHGYASTYQYNNLIMSLCSQTPIDRVAGYEVDFIHSPRPLALQSVDSHLKINDYFNK